MVVTRALVWLLPGILLRMLRCLLPAAAWARTGAADVGTQSPAQLSGGAGQHGAAAAALMRVLICKDCVAAARTASCRCCAQ
jgi:ABC-type thiamine transport system ATPase subunit